MHFETKFAPTCIFCDKLSVKYLRVVAMANYVFEQFLNHSLYFGPLRPINSEQKTEFHHNPLLFYNWGLLGQMFVQKSYLCQKISRKKSFGVVGPTPIHLGQNGLVNLCQGAFLTSLLFFSHSDPALNLKIQAWDWKSAKIYVIEAASGTLLD